MKYMMVFMAFMFYKVPSGLGLYFITSSLWSICERLLLPKTVSSGIVKGDEGKGSGGGGDGGKGGGPEAPAKPPGRFAQFWEKVIDEASKDATYRKLTEEKDKDKESDKTRGRDEGRDRDAREREKTKPPAEPGGRPFALIARLDPADTIAAIASAPGPGFRGIVRVTGPEAIRIALNGFTPDDPLAKLPPKRPRRIAGAYQLEGLRPRLPADLLLWPGPRSHTGQPMAEAHTLGAPPLLQALLAHTMAQGARLAERGEFTLRAFLSGRIDLTRAEAVLGVIDARDQAQLDAALGQLAGGLFHAIAGLRDRLLDTLAHLEAGLDFVEESDVSELGRIALAEDLARGAADLDAMAGRLSSRERVEGNPRVVLVGPPNAGKSRLFNALLGTQRAIVSPTPGTTRDYLTAPCDCDGLTVTLVDTAGAETARSPVEERAQALRDEQAERADLLLDCHPADAPAPTAPVVAPARPRLEVLTKSDLAPGWDSPSGGLPTSAATGEGLDALKRAIAQAIRAEDEGDSLATTTGARCRDSLTRASASLADASRAVTLELGDELVAIDLRQALDELGKVVGAIVTDDILDRIFARFCIGK
jgi:tRNA modification GTPase